MENLQGCKGCYKRIQDDAKLRYCICNYCNFCHNEKICPDGKHLYKQIDPKNPNLKRESLNGCKSCGIRKNDEAKTDIEICYCICQHCNLCHRTGICPDKEHWFEESVPNKTKLTRKPFLPNQSHGGHDWIPSSKNK